MQITAVTTMHLSYATGPEFHVHHYDKACQPNLAPVLCLHVL